VPSDPSHWPAPGRPVPSGTYRIQLRREFDFAALTRELDYLAALGVSHVYLSPILQAVPGSAHGYDVVDHSRISDDLGGGLGFAHLRSALAPNGLGLIADVVPNHMAVPTPARLNEALWSVLRVGPLSPYASWFDVDWSVDFHALLMPVLGERVGDVLDAGEITLDDTAGGEPVLRYHEHVFPVRPGTEHLPLPELLDRQWYRLAHWRLGNEELNYRRFFDIDTLAGLRVEREEVFAESHAVLVAMVAEGSLDGLRIDHPDGLADPSAYLRRLGTATGGSWVVVEKILEGDEDLPADWECAGTTGYDALLRVGGLFVDPEGEAPLTQLYEELNAPGDFHEVVETSKREVLQTSLYAEVERLVGLAAGIIAGDIRLRDHTRQGLREAITELIVGLPVYRAYVVPRETASATAAGQLDDAAALARRRVRDDRRGTVDLVRDLALGRLASVRDRGADRDEFIVRFQQTCGPAMAKGVEDTAFYRWFRFAALNEVGGDPARFGVDPEEFHEYASRQQLSWPVAMTTLSTHDTKRSEDVRARLAVLSELPEVWAAALRSWRSAATAYHSGGVPGPAVEYLIWQTLVGTWPIGTDRLLSYLEKAIREAKLDTSWVEPNEPYERAVRGFAETVLADHNVTEQLAAFVARIEPYVRSVVLGQKLVQLTMPGVPDVYQGCELVDLSLVDPDNRRPVDFGVRRGLLADLDAGKPAGTLDEEKLLVTSRALRLRREQPAWFGPDSTYEPLATSTPHAVAFCRSDSVVTLVTRLAARLERSGGWGEGQVTLPPGRWRDVLADSEYDGGDRELGRLLARMPVSLLVRD
jgi:(1->4)-alpha-D-glucan 1-alpha-D-glucosylmutase